MLHVRILTAVLALAWAGASAAAAPAADTIYWHGDVLTVDDAHPRAQAVAVRGGLIVAVGSDRQVGRLRRPRQTCWADACPTGKPTAP